MKAPRHGRSKSTYTYYWNSFTTEPGSRFILILLGLAAALSFAISALTFAQNPGKVLQAESRPQPAAVEPQKRSAPSQKGPTAKRSRRSDQDQELQARSQARGQDDERERGRRDGKPREWRMRRARPFNGD